MKAVRDWVKGGGSLLLIADHMPFPGAAGTLASAFGVRFRASGYSLWVPTLPPGTYDVAVFPHSAVTNAFSAAKVVRVTVR